LRAAELAAHHVRSVAALGRGDFAGTYRHGAAISPAGLLASHVGCALWVLLDLVEAAVRTGRPAEAAAHVRAMRDAGLERISPRLSLIAAGAAALAAPRDRARALFESALATPRADQWPFDLARVRLLLYLSHRTVAAHLYQIFPRLGITSRAALRDALDALPDPTEEKQ
jgi:hypothetical protein